jgi:hypothetical protein
MSTRGTAAQRWETRLATGWAVMGVTDLPLGVLDLVRGNYAEGIAQVVFFAPISLLLAYLLYRRAQWA